MKAYEEGYAAGETGAKARKNPYSGDRAHMWEAGRLDAFADLEAEFTRDTTHGIAFGLAVVILLVVVLVVAFTGYDVVKAWEVFAK